MRHLASISSAICVWFLASTAHAQSHCTLQNLGNLGVIWDNNRALVQIHANGQQPYALVDTGAEYTVLFQSGAQQLGLRVRPISSSWFEGIGGSAALGVARVPGFAIVGDHTRDEDVAVVGTPGRGRSDVVMLLGQDVLRVADVEFDFANAQLRFFSPHGDCQHAALAYWGAQYSQVPMGHAHGNWLVVRAQLNGNNITVLLDTGAPLSVVSLAAANAAGVTIDRGGTVAADDLHGIGSRSVDSWLSRFNTFTLGGETIQNARLRIADFGHRQGLSGIDMILGADFFRTHRVLAAYSQGTLYFSYIRGAVFQTVGAAELPSGADAGAQVDPTSAEAFFNRANLRLQQNAISDGIADLDQAIRINPRFTAAILRRGEVREYQRDWEHAIQDFDEVAVLSPNDASIQNARCWLRAISGRELEVARAACDAGLHISPTDADMLDSRGMVGLKQQRWQDAWNDYDAAVRIDSTEATFVFGRGVAALRLGRTTEGQADIARATQLDPNVAQTYAGYGITP